MINTDSESLRTKITNEEVRELPLAAFGGEIFLVEDHESLQRVLPLLKEEKVLGFDTETRPSFRKGKKHQVALLQLATKDRAFLIRLNKIGLPRQVAEILASPKVIKAGVAIHDDISALKKHTMFAPAGFVELQNYVKQFGIEDFSLKKIAAIVLNIRISKSKQLSNWASKNLSSSQQSYAATDAWVGHQIYTTLKSYLDN